MILDEIQNIFMSLDPWTRFWIYYGSLTIAGTLSVTLILTLTLTQKDN